jgi:hypothetical protein
MEMVGYGRRMTHDMGLIFSANLQVIFGGAGGRGSGGNSGGQRRKRKQTCVLK